MRITIASVGKMRQSPELELVDLYAERFRKTGLALGFRSLDLLEVPSGGGTDAEGQRLLAALPKIGAVWRLDEHGRNMPSKQFADELARRRDDGVAHLCFLIGGAEGYSKEVRSKCPQTISFGVQTWPHRFVRFMLAEQLYRAASLLAGTPYHKA